MEIAAGHENKTTFISNKTYSGLNHINSDGISVQMNKLDDLNLSFPNFIKIDMECFKLHTLKRLENTLIIHKPMIQLELQKPLLESFNTPIEDVWLWLNNLGQLYDSKNRLWEK